MSPPRLVLCVNGLSNLSRYNTRACYSIACSSCHLPVAIGRSLARVKIASTKPRTLRGARQHTTDTHTGDLVGPQSSDSTPDPKVALKSALLDLQKHSRSYVNISRLQLALRGLEQGTGEETIRVAILGLAGQGNTSKKIRDLVRLLLADPLKEEEEWERILSGDTDLSRPLLLRVGEDNLNEVANYGLSNRLVREINISSPNLNNHRLEILVLESDILAEAAGQDSIGDAILVPSVEIPTSSTGRYTPVTTPVHKALVLGDGILGAATLANFPGGIDSQIILPAVDLPHYADTEKNLPFLSTDVLLAGSALLSFRKSLDNALDYEHEWFKTGLPEILAWLKDGTIDTPGGKTLKEPVHHLISSILIDADQRVRDEEVRQLANALSSRVTSSDLQSLQKRLECWAEDAHTELRDQLNIAFEGARWRKLGWWKLFWRVDDVSMIASDILNQRFLIDAEKDIIYLAGNVEQSGVFKSLPAIQNRNWAYKKIADQPATTAIGSTPGPLYIEDLLDTPKDDIQTGIKEKPWPLHIPTTRSFLSLDTVPALQALAQKLVIQTLSTSGFVSAFAGLIYISSMATTLYEAGAVAALGVVWSLRRMQKKWETARSFWEDEVREEGRKAVRATEGVVGAVIRKPVDGNIVESEELKQAQKAIEQARSTLNDFKARVKTGKEESSS
jgi:hypothetical protein